MHNDNEIVAINYGENMVTFNKLYKAINNPAETISANTQVIFSSQLYPSPASPREREERSVITTLPPVGNQLVPVSIFAIDLSGKYTITFKATIISALVPQSFAIAINGAIDPTGTIVIPASTVAGVNIPVLLVDTLELHRRDQITILNTTSTPVALPLISNLPNAMLTIIKE
jgi:hypothetical protein